MAIGLPATAEGSPYTTCFQQRKEWLELKLSEVDTKITELQCRDSDSHQITKLEVERGAYLNRRYVIREFTAEIVNNRLGDRLGLMARCVELSAVARPRQLAWPLG